MRTLDHMRTRIPQLNAVRARVAVNKKVASASGHVSASRRVQDAEARRLIARFRALGGRLWLDSGVIWGGATSRQLDSLKFQVLATEPHVRRLLRREAKEERRVYLEARRREASATPRAPARRRPFPVLDLDDPSFHARLAELEGAGAAQRVVR